MPSGSRVYGELYPDGFTGPYSYPPYLDAWIVVIGNRDVEGLCGSPDNNPDNDLKVNGTGKVMQPVNGMVPPEVSESWR